MTGMPALSDTVLPFAVEGLDVRGRIVRLQHSVDEIVRVHEDPLPVQILLAEAVALVALVGTSLKFKGKISLQLRSEGAIRMLIVDLVTPDALRGYIRVEDPAAASGEGLVAPDGTARLDLLMGAGTFALFIDQGEHMDRYQAVVALEGQSLAAAAEAYFRQSEQIATSFTLAAEPPGARPVNGNGSSGPAWRAGGIMIQHMPSAARAPATGEPAEEAFARCVQLLGTMAADELLDGTLADTTLLYRLYHEDGVRVFEPGALVPRCGCRPESIEAVLKTYAPEDLADMVEDGVIAVQCEFCKTKYRFDPATLDEIKENGHG